MNNSAQFTVKKSAAPAVTILRILFFWLIIPLIVMIVDILKKKSYTVEFYSDKYVVKEGILSKNESQSVFMGVYSVSIRQSLWGRIFNYGDIEVDAVGQWDLDLEGVKNPKAVKRYLDQFIATKSMGGNGNGFNSHIMFTN